MRRILPGSARLKTRRNDGQGRFNLRAWGRIFELNIGAAAPPSNNLLANAGFELDANNDGIRTDTVKAYTGPTGGWDQAQAALTAPPYGSHQTRPLDWFIVG